MSISSPDRQDILCLNDGQAHPGRRPFRRRGRVRDDPVTSCVGTRETPMSPGTALALFGGDDGLATGASPCRDARAQPPAGLDAVRLRRLPQLRMGQSASTFVLIRDWALAARAADSAAPASVFPEATVIALGNFDGVHRGHRLLLAEARSRAERCGAWPAVMTPEPHPRTALGGERRGLRLSGLRDKCRLIAEAGVPVIFAPRFTAAFASLSPEAFVEHVLLGAWRACHVVVGEDFRFGRGRRGDVDLLYRLLRARGVGLSVVPLLEHRGRPVSSERIRRHLAAGDIAEAITLLGRPWEVTGRISASPHSGTAGVTGWRLHLAPALLRPPAGVYTATLRLAARPTAMHGRASSLRDDPWPVTVTVSPAGIVTVHPQDPTIHHRIRPGRHVVLAWRNVCIGAHHHPCDRRSAFLSSITPATRRQMS